MAEKKQIEIIGRAEQLEFPSLGMSLHARIDTGARTSALWVSSAEEIGGVLQVQFLGPNHPQYTGDMVTFHEFSQDVVTSSNGHKSLRYKIKLPVLVKGRRIRASFTLADRSTQVYPVLVGRNILRGKFIVDVKEGTTLQNEERALVEEKRIYLKNAKHKGGRT